MWRIFIFCFSEPLGINSEVLNSFFAWVRTFYSNLIWQAVNRLLNVAAAATAREVIQPSTPYIALLASYNLDLEIGVVCRGPEFR